MSSYLTHEKPWSSHFYLYEMHYIEHLLWVLDQSILFTEHKHLFYKKNEETMWTLLFYKIVWNKKKIKWNKLLQILCFVDILPLVHHVYSYPSMFSSLCLFSADSRTLWEGQFVVFHRAGWTQSRVFWRTLACAACFNLPVAEALFEVSVHLSSAALR